MTESFDLYIELVLAVRTMFHQCKLVHADLSEYNILFHEGHLWIIDVSQSVEHDHPSAFDFLRKDLSNVEDFFGRLGVKCLGLRRIFEFVIKDDLATASDTSDEDVLRKWIEETPNNEDKDTAEDNESAAAHEDSIFKQSYIPRTLNELYDPERDVAAVERGEGAKLIYADTIGLVESPSTVDSQIKSFKSTTAVRFDTGKDGGNLVSAVQQQNNDSGSDSDSDSGSEPDSGDGEPETGSAGGYKERKPRGHRHEDREAKKVDFIGAFLIHSTHSSSVLRRTGKRPSKQRQRRKDRIRCPRVKRRES